MGEGESSTVDDGSRREKMIRTQRRATTESHNGAKRTSFWINGSKSSSLNPRTLAVDILTLTLHSKAITSSKVGGSTFERIEDAIDYVSNRLSFDDSCLLAMRHTAADAFRGSSSSHDLLTSCCPSNSLHSTGPDLKNVLDRNQAQIPSELINYWVATFLMIQVRERQRTL